MPSINYAGAGRCVGGGHVYIDVSIAGGPVERITYTTDELRRAFSEVSTDDRDQAILMILKFHMANKTRAQMVAEFQAGPVVITI